MSGTFSTHTYAPKAERLPLLFHQVTAKGFISK